eukprot:PhM_4_TR19131/c0_g1_i1/m.65161
MSTADRFHGAKWRQPGRVYASECHVDDSLRYLAKRFPCVDFSREPRFGWDEKKKEKALKEKVNPGAYDVARAYRATEPASFSASVLPPRKERVSTNPGPSLSETSTRYNTISQDVQTSTVGRFGKFKRDTSAWFTFHMEGPGPIYNPNYVQVDISQPSAKVLPHRDGKQVESPDPFTYADGALHAQERVSTYSKSPCHKFGTTPTASQMPLPYDRHNLCNSRSMRTKLYEKVEEGRVRDDDDGDKNMTSSQRRLTQEELMRRAMTPLQRSTRPGVVFDPLGSPFRAAATTTTTRSRPMSAPLVRPRVLDFSAVSENEQHVQDEVDATTTTLENADDSVGSPRPTQAGTDPLADTSRSSIPLDPSYYKRYRMSDEIGVIKLMDPYSDALRYTSRTAHAFYEIEKKKGRLDDVKGDRQQQQRPYWRSFAQQRRRMLGRDTK